MELSNKGKIKVLMSARNNLLHQQKRGFDVTKELDTVRERIKHYKWLDKTCKAFLKKCNPKG